MDIDKMRQAFEAAYVSHMGKKFEEAMLDHDDMNTYDSFSVEQQWRGYQLAMASLAKSDEEILEKCGVPDRSPLRLAVVGIARALGIPEK